LYNNGKQIVLSSDRPPKDIAGLEKRLVSRFEGGLMVDIKMPETETRTAILRKKMETADVEIPDDVIVFIAENIKSNVRELNGALNKIIAHTRLTKSTPSVEDAKEILEDMIPIPPAKAPEAVAPKPEEKPAEAPAKVPAPKPEEKMPEKKPAEPMPAKTPAPKTPPKAPAVAPKAPAKTPTSKTPTPKAPATKAPMPKVPGKTPAPKVPAPKTPTPKAPAKTPAAKAPIPKAPELKKKESEEKK
jgi:hypothetical protein